MSKVLNKENPPVVGQLYKFVVPSTLLETLGANNYTLGWKRLDPGDILLCVDVNVLAQWITAESKTKHTAGAVFVFGTEKVFVDWHEMDFIVPITTGS